MVPALDHLRFLFGTHKKEREDSVKNKKAKAPQALLPVKLPPPGLSVFNLGNAGCSVCVPEAWTQQQVEDAIGGYLVSAIANVTKTQKCQRHPARLHWSVAFEKEARTK